MTDEVTQVHRRRRLSRLSLTLLFVAIIVLAMIPFWAIFVATFQDGNMIVRYGLNLGIDLSTASLDNWIHLFTDSGSYFRWFFNSTILTVLQVVLTLFISAFVAYGFAMYEFRFKTPLFITVLLLMSVPFEMMMLPLYIQINDMQLQDTYAAIILPFLAHAVTIMFFRQYMRGIPKDIVEAGRIDGVTEFGIFFRLVLPLTKPAFAAMAILNGMNSWNNFLWPLLALRSPEKYTLPIGLNTLLTPYGNNYELLIVGSFFSMIPIFILFIAFQRFFIEGMTAGAVKGRPLPLSRPIIDTPAAPTAAQQEDITSMKLKKFAAAALAAGMAAFGLSACQTAGNQPAPEDTGSVITQAPVEGATELNLWTFVELHGKFYTTMAEQWNELHPDKKVQIKVNALPYDDMHNKLQIALTSGTGAPDIADIEAGKFPQFVIGTPALMDLTEAAAPYKDDIVQARLDLFSANGGLYGLDFHVGATVAFYNTELLEAAGIDYTTIKTWDDYRDAGAKYHEATGKYLGTVDTSAAWATGLLLAQLGGEYFDAEGKINLTSPEMTQAMEIFKGLQDAGAAAVPPGGQPDTEEAFGAYNNGDFAAAVMPFWFTSRYLAYMPDFAGKIAIAPPPTVPNPKSISVGGGGTGTAVVKDGPHADLAAEFVAWAKLSKEGNIETWNMLGFDPLNTDVWSDEAVTHNPDNEFVKYFKNNPFEPLLEIKDSIGHLQSFTNPGMPAVNNMLNTQTFNDMFENNVPIADALAQAQADLENELG